MKVRDIMVAELVTLHVDEELSLASDIMNLARIRHLPIMEGAIEFAPVSIGDGSDLGMGALILPGTRIGRGVQVGFCIHEQRRGCKRECDSCVSSRE